MTRHLNDDNLRERMAAIKRRKTIRYSYPYYGTGLALAYTVYQFIK